MATTPLFFKSLGTGDVNHKGLLGNVIDLFVCLFVFKWPLIPKRIYTVFFVVQLSPFKAEIALNRFDHDTS